MKYVKISAYKIGLVFKNENYSKVLTEGNYWLMPSETCKVYDMTEPFTINYNLNILLQDTKIASMLDIVEVKDNEVFLQYENELFKTTLTTGKYAFWKGLISYTYTKVDLSKIEITEAINLTTLTTKLLPFVRTFNVESYEKALLFVDGKFQKQLDAGTYYWWKNSISIHVAKIDTRILQIEISGQEILTKDKASLRLNFFAQYKIIDIIKAALENKDYEKQLYVSIQLALREYIGTLTLDELLEKKESVSSFIITSITSKTEVLGVSIVGCGIKDIILSGEMKDIMNQVLIAEKKAQANIIMRREETASTRSLLNTAKLMEENEMLFRLKEMEYIEKIADKINTISVTGGGQVLDQLKQMFISGKK